MPSVRGDTESVKASPREHCTFRNVGVPSKSCPVGTGPWETEITETDRSLTALLAYPEGDCAAIEAFFDDWTSGRSGEWSKSNSTIGGDGGSLDRANWIEASGDASSMIRISIFCLMETDTIDGDNCVSVDINVPTE